MALTFHSKRTEFVSTEGFVRRTHVKPILFAVHRSTHIQFQWEKILCPKYYPYIRCYKREIIRSWIQRALNLSLKCQRPCTSFCKELWKNPFPSLQVKPSEKENVASCYSHWFAWSSPVRYEKKKSSCSISNSWLTVIKAVFGDQVTFCLCLVMTLLWTRLVFCPKAAINPLHCKNVQDGYSY